MFLNSSGMIWNGVLDSAGYNVKDVVSTTKGTDSLNPQVRDESITYLINNMVRCINFRQPYKPRVSICVEVIFKMMKVKI